MTFDQTPWATALKVALLITILGCVAHSSAQTHAPTASFETLATFNLTTGAYPASPLAQGRDGNFYGTTTGIEQGQSTIFKVTPDGTLTTVANFAAGTVPNPMGALALGDDGNFYGTTKAGGNSSGDGQIFRITPDGVLTILYVFQGTDGIYPYGALVRSSRGSYFYGSTLLGSTSVNGGGSLFRVDENGKLTTLYGFCPPSKCSDGTLPTGVVEGVDGNLYGTTSQGGTGAYCTYFLGCGTIFKFDIRANAFTTLYNFCSQPGCTDGYGSEAALIVDLDGNFRGTTQKGGSYTGDNCASEGCGTIFKFTRTGTFTTLHQFHSLDGNAPASPLVQATDSAFYGVTPKGGIFNMGTVFMAGAGTSFTRLYQFCAPSCSSGALPAGLVQGTDGRFYGVGMSGGDVDYNYGDVFRVSTGLAPFVSIFPTSAAAGAQVEILGQGFTGATDVSFNGVPAAFTVVSDTFLTATAPSGVSVGSVTVTTPSGLFTSNKPFRER